MLADLLSWMARHGRALTACAVLAALLGPAGVSQAAAKPAPGMKQVSYLGYTFRIPSSWAVISDADHPHGCVRFDVHAVYLGAPGANQSCPSWLFGTTEAVLIQPGQASAVRLSQEDPTSREITVTAPRISMMATFDTDPTQIYQILASAALPAPAIEIPNPARLDADGAPAASPVPPAARPRALTSGARKLGASHATASASHATASARQQAQRGAVTASGASLSTPDLPASVADFRGLGFDSCAAPSAAFMRAWHRSSPYRAVGIYIGGADRACDQRNLTRAWVTREASAGWHFIPMYAGPQAAFSELNAPARQGTRAAADAVTQAERLGFGSQTPIYYDMEAYPSKDTGVALRFLSAWTIGLHKLGYKSGVYSSSRSGIVDLARQYSRHAYAMPDVIYDALWNGSPNTADKSFQAGEWANHRRIHQYSGNVTQTYGHDTIDIDQDYLNVDLPGPAGTPQASQAVSLPSGAVDMFYKGAHGQLWREAASAGSGWARPVDMGGKVGSVPSAVSTGTGALDVFYRGTDRNLREVSFQSGRWAPARRLTAFGVLGGAPRAVAQADGVIDVFWRGTSKSQLWHARFSPGHGWSGPQLLGGGLSSDPSPVESAPGNVEVYWKGTNRSLWYVGSRNGGSWSKPASLGMGPLGGPAHATAQANGSVEVFWRGIDRHHVWAAFDGPGGLQGPVDLGGTVTGSPWAVTAAGAVRLLWRGPGGALWDEQRTARGRWSAPAMLRIGRKLASAAPFAAAGSAASALWVFWRGKGGGLWSESLAGSTWSKPLSLG